MSLCLEKNTKKTCKSAEYLTIAENLSSDPNVVEVALTASDNEVQILSDKPTQLYNYNKSFPGPLIEAKVGDTLIVNFFNDISEPSSLVWHGLTRDQEICDFQAREEFSFNNSYSRDHISPGETYKYRFRLTKAGIYWYHSSVHSRKQTSMGLFGAVIVKNFEEDAKYSLPSTEKILAFSDLKLDRANQVDLEFSSIPEEKLEQEINGIVGNVLLTNGVYNGSISLTKNVPTRLYLLNAASDRFMKISLEGHDMLRIGGDQGLLERPILIKENNGLILTSGERAEVVFVPRRNSIRLFTESNVRGYQKVVKDRYGNCELEDEVNYLTEKLVLVTFSCTSHKEEREKEDLQIPLKLKNCKKILVDHCTSIIPIEYNSKNIPKEIIKICEGNYIIEIVNSSRLGNNFHLRGYTFQHIDTIDLKTGKRIENSLIENKDTIYIPRNSVIRLALQIKNIQSKEDIFFQSHILTNAEMGEKGVIQIIAECKNSTVNNYSSYSSGDHTTCLRRDYSSILSSSSSSTLNELTSSLVTCKCGSGLSASYCSCHF